MTPLSDFVPLVRPYIHKCPDPTLQRALVDAARELSRQSHCLKQNIKVSTVAGQSAYLLSPASAQHEIIFVDRVEWEDRTLAPVAPEDMQDTGPGEPNTWYCASPDVLVLNPAPKDTLTNVLTATIVVQPALTATYLHDHFRRRFDTALREGALYLLKMMPNEAWSDPTTALHHKDNFKQLALDAKNNSLRGNRPGSIYIKQRRF